MGKSCNTEMFILKYLKEHIVKGLCNSVTFILTNWEGNKTLRE